MRLPLVVLFTVLNRLAYTGNRVMVSLFALHEGASALAVGVLMSLLALLSMLISVPVGRLVDCIGVYRPRIALGTSARHGACVPRHGGGNDRRGLASAPSARLTGRRAASKIWREKSHQ